MKVKQIKHLDIDYPSLEWKINDFLKREPDVIAIEYVVIADGIMAMILYREQARVK